MDTYKLDTQGLEVSADGVLLWTRDPRERAKLEEAFATAGDRYADMSSVNR
jgi:hypothetical protein